MLNQTAENDGLDANTVERIARFQSDDIRLVQAVRNRLSAEPNVGAIFDDLFRTGVIREIHGSFKLDLGRPFLGCGWYAPELHGGEPTRWSGPETKAMLYLPISRRTRRAVEMKLLKPDELPAIVLYDGETRLDTRGAKDGHVVTLKCELAPVPGVKPCITSLTIDHGRVIRQDERGGPDLRPLGVLLLSVRVT